MHEQNVRDRFVKVMTKSLQWDLGEVAELGDDTEMSTVFTDSLDIMDLIFGLEEEFGITIPEESPELVERLRTFGSVVGLIEELLAVKRMAA